MKSRESACQSDHVRYELLEIYTTIAVIISLLHHIPHHVLVAIPHKPSQIRPGDHLIVVMVEDTEGNPQVLLGEQSRLVARSHEEFVESDALLEANVQLFVKLQNFRLHHSDIELNFVRMNEVLSTDLSIFVLVKALEQRQQVLFLLLVYHVVRHVMQH